LTLDIREKKNAEETRQKREKPLHDARNDPRTRELANSYLEPLGITSLLDAPIRLQGALGRKEGTGEAK